MSGISEEEAKKLAEAISGLTSSFSVLSKVHSDNLKRNVKVCWYLKKCKERQERLKPKLIEMQDTSS